MIVSLKSIFLSGRSNDRRYLLYYLMADTWIIVMIGLYHWTHGSGPTEFRVGRNASTGASQSFSYTGNQLTSGQHGGVTTQHTYDGNGRLSASGSWSYYYNEAGLPSVQASSGGVTAGFIRPTERSSPARR